MILGIEASNLYIGGAISHIRGLFAEARPEVFGFKKVVLWGRRWTLENVPDTPWLEKRHHPLFEKTRYHRLFWQKHIHPKEIAAMNPGLDLLWVPAGTYTGKFRPYVIFNRNLLPFDHEARRCYGISKNRLRLHALEWSQGRAYRRADGVMFLTEGARRQVLESTGSLKCPTAVVPHGISARFFQKPRPARPLARCDAVNPLRILYVNQINNYKFPWVLAEAVAALRKSGLPVRLDFIGQPTYPMAVERLRGTLNRLDPGQEFMSYLGEVPHLELEKNYQTAELFVYSSTCEAFGNVLLEAMAAGLPIVCSNRSVMPEVLGDRGGVYYDPESVESAREAVKRMATDHELRERCAEISYGRAKQFSWKRCAEETFGFLTRVGRGD